MIGRVMLGVLGKNQPAVSKMSGPAFEQSSRPISAETLEVSDRDSLIHVRDAHVFLDCLLLGTFQGVIDALDYEGTVKIALRSPHEGYVLSEFRRKG